VSLTTPWRGRGQHRGKTAPQLRRELDKALCDLVALATRLYEVTADRNQLEAQLDEAGIDLSGALHDLETAQRELTAVKAQLANATAISAPAGRRDVADGDQPTQPIPVLTLQQAHGIGPVLPVRDPGHVPSWADPAA
jgi:chromosome segregation ATPase